ncbi:vesicular glutamate transporter 1-like [Actinia tenebrosa]|uniref:Vesicular glutamate transporter 1-like n=1 Tax=Actinia tenebrosa TaxID=6105 RepID=A0A6P8HZW9_ACTTE|nr:vesicular glutamate transporter 1-like [Actinia tenebrosa]
MTMPITGLLTKYGFDGGWGSVFYCFGVFGLLWYMVWLLFVHETPEQHPSMSVEERELLSHNDKDLNKVGKVNVPWMSILKSLPVWAIVAANFSLDWAFYVLLISIPKFLVEVFDTEIHKMGFMAAAPFLVKGICTPVAGLSADLLRKYTWSTKTVRRCFYAVGTLSTGAFILIAGYTNSVAVVVVCMAISGASTSLSYPAYTVNMLDIAPRCAGVIMGLCNTLGTTAGFISPILVGFVTLNQTLEEWQTVFWINAILMCIGTGLFCSFLEGDRQAWDVVEDSNDDSVDSSKNIEAFEPNN